MKESLKTRLTKIVLLLATVSVCSYAQGTAADYERAVGLKAKYEAGVVDIAGAATWIGNTHRVWYRKLSRGVNVYMIFDADTSQKNTAFDHDKIVASLSKLTGNTYKSQDLQLAQLRFDNGVTSFNANVDGTAVRCTIADSVCTKTEFPTRPQAPVRSPDNKWEALIVNYNLAIKAIDAREPIVLSTDGSEGNYYNARSIFWSPDSTKIAVYRVRPGYKREVRYIESSPEDQVQPKFSSIVYAKPGDVLDLEQPVLFDVATRKQINIDNALFANPYEIQIRCGAKTARRSRLNTTNAVIRFTA